MDAQLHTGDCLQIMPQIAEASVDMVLADLPYGMTRNEWDRVIDMPAMWSALRRTCKLDAAIVLMAAQPFASRLICSNLPEFRYDLIWRKNKPTGFLNAKKQPLRSHEHILVFYRSPPTFNPQKTHGHLPGNKARQTSRSSNYGRMTARPDYGGNTDRYPTSVIDWPIINNDSPEKIHPTQKPVGLMEWLILSYTKSGDTVLDNAMGSGTTGVACARLGRKFIGIDLAPTWVNATEQRLSATNSELIHL